MVRGGPSAHQLVVVAVAAIPFSIPFAIMVPVVPTVVFASMFALIAVSAIMVTVAVTVGMTMLLVMPVVLAMTVVVAARIVVVVPESATIVVAIISPMHLMQGSSGEPQRNSEISSVAYLVTVSGVGLGRRGQGYAQGGDGADFE